MPTAHQFSFKAIDGAAMELAAFKGKVVLLVNTASACGFTPQYKGLEELWRNYRDKGFVVLGVPSNDFGAQEPGTESEIQTFCTSRFSVDFPLTSKVSVVGSAAHPLYKWIAQELGDAGIPKWNFHKYVIGKDGHIAATFGSRTAPDSAELREAIEHALRA